MDNAARPNLNDPGFEASRAEFEAVSPDPEAMAPTREVSLRV